MFMSAGRALWKVLIVALTIIPLFVSGVSAQGVYGGRVRLITLPPYTAELELAYTQHTYAYVDLDVVMTEEAVVRLVASVPIPFDTTVVVKKGVTTSVTLPVDLFRAVQAGRHRYTLSVIASTPVEAVVYSSFRHCGDTYRPLAVESWQKSYTILCAKADRALPSLMVTADREQHTEYQPATISIVAHYANTVVQLTPACKIDTGGPGSVSAGSLVLFRLDSGESMTVTTIDEVADLSGTIVTSSHPVGILQAHVLGSVPTAPTRFRSHSDMYFGGGMMRNTLAEWALPNQLAGTEFIARSIVTVAPSRDIGIDYVKLPEGRIDTGGVIRVVAMDNATELMSVSPLGERTPLVTLQRGDVYDFPPSIQSTYMEATKPVHVGLFTPWIFYDYEDLHHFSGMSYRPSFVMIPSFERGSSSFIHSYRKKGAQMMISCKAPDRSAIVLNGMLLSSLVPRVSTSYENGIISAVYTVDSGRCVVEALDPDVRFTAIAYEPNSYSIHEMTCAVSSPLDVRIDCPLPALWRLNAASCDTLFGIVDRMTLADIGCGVPHTVWIHERRGADGTVTGPDSSGNFAVRLRRTGLNDTSFVTLRIQSRNGIVSDTTLTFPGPEVTVTEKTGANVVSRRLFTDMDAREVRCDTILIRNESSLQIPYAVYRSTTPNISITVTPAQRVLLPQQTDTVVICMSTSKVISDSFRLEIKSECSQLVNLQYVIDTRPGRFLAGDGQLVVGSSPVSVTVQLQNIGTGAVTVTDAQIVSNPNGRWTVELPNCPFDLPSGASRPMKVIHAADDGGVLEPLRVVFTTGDRADNADSLSLVTVRRPDITSIDVDDKAEGIAGFDTYGTNIVVYDHLGRVVKMSTTGILPGLPRGVYVVVGMSDGGNVFSRRIIVK